MGSTPLASIGDSRYSKRSLHLDCPLKWLRYKFTFFNCTFRYILLLFQGQTKSHKGQCTNQLKMVCNDPTESGVPKMVSTHPCNHLAFFILCVSTLGRAHLVCQPQLWNEDSSHTECIISHTPRTSARDSIRPLCRTLRDHCGYYHLVSAYWASYSLHSTPRADDKRWRRCPGPLVFVHSRRDYGCHQPTRRPASVWMVWSDCWN